MSVRQTNPCLKSLKSKWRTAGRGGGRKHQVCLSKGQKQHRTDQVCFFSNSNHCSVLQRASFCPAKLTGLCLSLRMLELPESAMFDSTGWKDNQPAPA